MRRVFLPPAQIRLLIGKNRRQIRDLMIGALHNAGIDVSDLKKIEWQRTPDDGCIFVGPVRS